MRTLCGVLIALGTIAGCEDPAAAPLTRAVSHSPGDVVIAIQQNRHAPVSTGLVRIGTDWQSVSLPARRLVPYCSSARRGSTLLFGRMDGKVCCVDDVAHNPRVRELQVKVSGPIVFMQLVHEDWIIVGHSEIVFGHFSQSSNEMTERGRRRIDSFLWLNGKAELIHAAHNEPLNTLVMCFSNGAVVTVEGLLTNTHATEPEPKVRMLGDIAAIGTIGDTTYLLTVEGSCVSFGLNERGDPEFTALWNNTMRCGHKSFLLSNRSWAVETNNGQSKEIHIIVNHKYRLLMEGDAIRLLGHGGDSETVLVGLDKKMAIQRIAIEDGRVLESVDLSKYGFSD